MEAIRSRRVAVVGLAVVGLVLLGACGREASTSAATSGVLSGKVTAGPTCPVERVGHPCPPTPVVADVQARAGARVVASTRSAADGSYRLEVPAGAYTVVAVTGSMFPRCNPVSVVVSVGHTTHTDITCDTGIR